MIEWRIYYDDGSTYDNETGSWADAPHRGVQYVQHLDERDPSDPKHVGSLTNTGDFYLWWPGARWPWGCDVMGMLDYLIEVGAITEDHRLSDLSVAFLAEHGVKLGRSVGDSGWQEIQAWVRSDPDLPRKSAMLPKGGVGR